MLKHTKTLDFQGFFYFRLVGAGVGNDSDGFSFAFLVIGQCPGNTCALRLAILFGFDYYSGFFVVLNTSCSFYLSSSSTFSLFSNSLAPAIVGASIKVFDILSSTTELRDRLEENTRYFKKQIIEAGFDIKPGDSPIVPIMLYDAALSQKFANQLLEEGVYAIGFFYPVVAKGQARIRTQISAAHTQADLDKAIAAFIKVGKNLNVIQC